MSFPFGPVLGAVGSIVGGLLGNDEAEEAREQQQDQFERNIALQREFAQQGIRWKVEDAKAAGLHPLAAIGMQGASYSPVSSNFVGSSAMDLSSIGQNIGRAIDATRTPEETEEERKNREFESQKRTLELEGIGLRNDYLRSQIAQMNQVQSTPGMPTVSNRYKLDGQTQSGLIKDKPMERTPAAPERPSQEPGATTDLGFSYTVNRGWAPMMSKDVKDKLEEDFPGMIGWNIRNRLLPMLGRNMNPPPVPLQDGYRWHYDSVNQEYRQIPIRESDWSNRRKHLGTEAGWQRSFGGR